MKQLLTAFGSTLIVCFFSTFALASAIHINTLVDPPVTASNLSGKMVKLTWQTTVEDTALSPARTMTLDAGAKDVVADKGLFWFINQGSNQTIKNVVYVSVVGDDGMYVTQARLDDEITSQIETAKKIGIHIVVTADGTLDLKAASEN